MHLKQCLIDSIFGIAVVELIIEELLDRGVDSSQSVVKTQG